MRLFDIKAGEIAKVNEVEMYVRSRFTEGFNMDGQSHFDKRVKLVINGETKN